MMYCNNVSYNQGVFHSKILGLQYFPSFIQKCQLYTDQVYNNQLYNNPVQCVPLIPSKSVAALMNSPTLVLKRGNEYIY